MKCRWSGHTNQFYSVAQHSVLVVYVLYRRGYQRNSLLAGLVHDGCEYVLPDIPTPIKHDLGASWADIEARVDSVIYGHFGVSALYSPTIAAIKQVDKAISYNEERALFAAPYTHLGPGCGEVHRIVPWSQAASYEIFLKTLDAVRDGDLDDYFYQLEDEGRV